MKWQVKYALQNIAKNAGPLTAELIDDDIIKVSCDGRPDAVAAILDAELIDLAIVEKYRIGPPSIDFLCGFKKSCVWEGAALDHLEQSGVGWGNFGTLCSAAAGGCANSATHKELFFSDRLLRQTTSLISNLQREYDRIYQLELKSGASVRLGMILDYEPTADAVRTLWERFGSVDVVWNVNPNGDPTKNAIDAGKELGCEVLKWEGLKEYLKTL